MATGLDGIAARLPEGLDARVAGGDDIERIVELQNRFATPVYRQSPALARDYARANPEQGIPESRQVFAVA